LKVLDRALSNYFVRMLDCWKFNVFIYLHSQRFVESVRQSPIKLFCWNVRLLKMQCFYIFLKSVGDLLKVLDRALSNYFVRVLDGWKFNAFIYLHFQRFVESVRQSPI